TIYERPAFDAAEGSHEGSGSRTCPVVIRVSVCVCGVPCERRRDRDQQRVSAARTHTERTGDCAFDGRPSPAPTATRSPLMVSRSIRGILGWGNLRGPCQAPLDCLRLIGAV